MNKKDIRVKKGLLLVFALLLVVQINFMGAKASGADTPWAVRTSSYSKTVTATSRGTTYFSVTSFASDYEYATLAIKTTGAWTIVTKKVNATAKANVKAGKSITGQVQVSNPSYLTYLNASGYFYY